MIVQKAELHPVNPDKTIQVLLFFYSYTSFQVFPLTHVQKIVVKKSHVESIKWKHMYHWDSLKILTVELLGHLFVCKKSMQKDLTFW